MEGRCGAETLVNSDGEIYVSTDIEADGPVPGRFSMLSLASAAYLADKTLVDTFSANLIALPDAETHPATMRWWQSQPLAWEACRENALDPAEVMPDYAEWLQRLPAKPVFVGYPANFDFMFVAWYLNRFAGSNPFGFAALDIKSFAMAKLGTAFHGTVKHKMPDAWFDEHPHTHVALDDAIEQGALFCNILQASG